MQPPTLTFDENGFLSPYEPVAADLATVERELVKAFPMSATRPAHFARLLAFNERLGALLPGGFRQWLDGSFVSRKLNPNDVDVLTFVDTALYERHERALRSLREEFATGAGKVDAHFIVIFPEGHRYRVFYESDRVRWLFDWSQTTRPPRRNKGFIELLTV